EICHARCIARAPTFRANLFAPRRGRGFWPAQHATRRPPRARPTGMPPASRPGDGSFSYHASGWEAFARGVMANTGLLGAFAQIWEPRGLRAPLARAQASRVERRLASRFRYAKDHVSERGLGRMVGREMRETRAERSETFAEAVRRSTAMR